MLDVLLTSSVSFIITFLAIPIVLQIAEEKKLFDIPDNRKVHVVPVPSLGGVGIFGGFILASLLSVSTYQNPEFQYFFAAAVVIFFLGLKDDLVILSASKKFIGQIIAASILIHLGDLKITSMHGLLGFTEISQPFSIALSYLTIIVVMNSFNLIDGVDGLAGSLGLLTMLVFGAYFFVIDMTSYAIMAFAMAGSLVAFLIFNHNPAKIFMGDCGSLMIGLVNSIMVIKFITVAETPAAAAFPLASAVAIGFSILIVPLLDTLRVFSIRIFNGKSPFTPDRNHFHHLLLDRGMSHNGVTLTCLSINIFFIAIAYACQSFGPSYLLMMMVALAFAGLGVLYYVKRSKPRLFVAKKLDEKEFAGKASKIVPLANDTVIVEQK